MHLLIDGYNLMGCSREFYGLDSEPLEDARDRLIERLARYRGVRGSQITLVFDGRKGGYPIQRKERKRGLEIIFSRLGEEADQVIKDMVLEGEKPYVVVTSDNEIIDFVEARGFASIRSGEFEKKMEMADYMNQKGMEREDGAALDSKIYTKKKGNPRKLPKKDRKLSSILKKI